MYVVAVIEAKRTTFWAPVDDLEVIDQRAQDLGMSRSRYLVTVGTGRDLPLLGAEGLTERVVVLERQMAAANKGLQLLGLLDGNDDI